MQSSPCRSIFYHQVQLLLFVCLLVCLFACLLVCLFVCVCVFVCLFVYLFICLFVCLLVCFFVRCCFVFVFGWRIGQQQIEQQSIVTVVVDHLFVCLAVCLSVVCLFVCLLFVCLLVCLLAAIGPKTLARQRWQFLMGSTGEGKYEGHTTMVNLRGAPTCRKHIRARRTKARKWGLSSGGRWMSNVAYVLNS